MDYKNGKIYAIRSHQTEDIYIGSTTTKLSKRFYLHKQHFKYWKEGKYRYTSSYDIIKYGDAYIQLLELCPCDSKMELERREGQLIRSMDCMNKRIEGRTDKEYRADNKEKISEYRQSYKKENKDKINQKYNCECGGKYTHRYKSRHFKTKKHQTYILNVEKLT